MLFNRLKHHRRSIRLKGYDYSEPGIYFVTLTVQDRAEIFGRFLEGPIELSPYGEIARDEWLRTPTIRPGVALDEYLIMPDHMHGIIVICEERNSVDRSLDNLVGANRYSPRRVKLFRSPSRTLGAIIRGFKGATTRRINELRGTPGAKVWQRNYYEHIVRDEHDLQRIQYYIRQNPLRWAEKRALLKLT